jgi:hypothetical protein
MHILHHDVDIQVQHPVDSASVGIDQVAAEALSRKEGHVGAIAFSRTIPPPAISAMPR